MTVKNLAFVRAIPGIGARLYESLLSVQQGLTAFEQQNNSSASSLPVAPPAINGVHVSTGPGGEFQVAITDNNQIARGVKYFAEHDTSPNFTNPHVIDMGTSRNHSTFLGSQTLFWRAYSSYQSSPPSAPAYHGGAAQPLAVTGGVIGTRAPSMGSGTGAPRQGLSGPGPVPQRSATSGFNWTAQSQSKVK